MPIRSNINYSYARKLTDIVNGDDPYQVPTDEELRLKNLYEFAEATKDQQLKESLGFIVMPSLGEISPVSIYRHREYINSISAKMAEKIEQTKKELEACFGIIKSAQTRKMCFKQLSSNHAILEEEEMIKVAGVDLAPTPRRSFKRSR